LHKTNNIQITNYITNKLLKTTSCSRNILKVLP